MLTFFLLIISILMSDDEASTVRYCASPAPTTNCFDWPPASVILSLVQSEPLAKVIRFGLLSVLATFAFALLFAFVFVGTVLLDALAFALTLEFALLLALTFTFAPPIMPQPGSKRDSEQMAMIQ